MATVDGEATSHTNVTATSLGQGFTAKVETITFLTGEQTKTFTVVMDDDFIQEKDETFSVQLSGQPEHTSLLTMGTATGTIVDDEASMTASVSRAFSTVEEDHAGPVQFMLGLSHPDTTASERNVAVGWQTTDCTATAGQVYQAAGGRYLFPVGAITAMVEVYLKDDNLFEPSLETFTMELVQQDTRLANLSPTGRSFEASIRDNETLTVSITAMSESVSEGNEATFTVTLTGGVPADTVEVPFETGGPQLRGTTSPHPLARSLSRPETHPAAREPWKYPPASSPAPSLTRPWPTERKRRTEKPLRSRYSESPPAAGTQLPHPTITLPPPT